MLLIKSIGSIKVCMYFRDHNPPHFHVLYSGYEELIIISSLGTFSGKIPPANRKKVIAWAKENQLYLMNKWKAFNPSKA